MSKRQLSKQQQRRIRNKQQGLLGDDAELSRDACNGLIISHYGRQLHVEETDSAERSTPILCHQRANLPPLVTGDRVVVEALDDNSGVVKALATRSNLLSRPDNRGRQKPVAANIDVVLLVVAALPEPFMNLIDRYLVAIENLGLHGSLLLNKVDLLDEKSGAKTRDLMSVYSALDYPVYEVSASSGAGMETLEDSLDGQTAVLVGQSGVGKSSLINSLGGEQLADVGALSAARDKGTHTTTTARLFHLRRFDVIDSPGIREFPIGDLDPEAILAGFRELRQLAGDCRFRNCSHDQEPGCALKAAVEAGQVDARRWQSYLQMLGRLEASRERADIERSIDKGQTT